MEIYLAELNKKIFGKHIIYWEGFVLKQIIIYIADALIMNVKGRGIIWQMEFQPWLFI